MSMNEVERLEYAEARHEQRLEVLAEVGVVALVWIVVLVAWLSPLLWAVALGLA